MTLPAASRGFRKKNPLKLNKSGESAFTVIPHNLSAPAASVFSK